MIDVPRAHRTAAAFSAFLSRREPDAEPAGTDVTQLFRHVADTGPAYR